MVRSRRAPVWWRLPGVVAAYQFVVAPSYIHMLANVAPSGRYTLTSAAYPTWAPHVGATFNGSSQYLRTGVLPNCGVGSLFLQYTNIANLNNSLAGCYNGGTFAQLIQYYNFNTMTTMNGTPGNVDHTPLLASGNYGVAGKTAYRNGVAEATTMAAGTATATFDIYLGCGNLFGSPSQYAQFTLQAVLIADRALSPAEVALVSKQMAYCQYNPAWNAWAPARRYFYKAPAAAASAAKMNTYYRRMRS